MSTILQEPSTEESAQLQYVIEQYLEEMRRLNVEMEADQLQIIKLRAETQEIAKQTRVTMAQLREAIAKLEAA